MVIIERNAASAPVVGHAVDVARIVPPINAACFAGTGCTIKILRFHDAVLLGIFFGQQRLPQYVDFLHPKRQLGIFTDDL